MVEGVSQVIVEVEDQDRALRFWTETLQFEPVRQSWGWWSMFEDEEGNRFALHPREATGVAPPRDLSDRC